MGIRETIEKYRGTATVIAAILCLGGIALAVWSNRSGIPAPLKLAYYTDDDGKTYFVDDINKVTPFDHNGKQAYRAFVYRFGAGKPFVAYMTCLTEKGRARMLELASQPREEAALEITQINQSSTQVKRPGETKWVSMNSAEAGPMMTPKRPDPSATLEAVYP
jgi:hypothetical protein